MGAVLIYNPADGRVLQYRKSVHTPDFEGRADVLINPDLSAVYDLDIKYWKVLLPNVVAMTEGEREEIDLADAAEAERQHALDRVSRGNSIVSKIGARVIQARLPEDAAEELMAGIQDVLLLLMTGQLAAAKRIAAALIPSGNIHQGHIDVLNNLLNEEID